MGRIGRRRRVGSPTYLASRIKRAKKPRTTYIYREEREDLKRRGVLLSMLALAPRIERRV